MRQRISALVLVPLGLWLAFAVVHLPEAGYGEAAAWLAKPWNTFLAMAVIAAGFFHGALGLRVIVEDYVHTVPAKLALLLMAKLLCAGTALAGILAIFRIAFMD